MQRLLAFFRKPKPADVMLAGVVTGAAPAVIAVAGLPLLDIAAHLRSPEGLPLLSPPALRAWQAPLADEDLRRAADALARHAWLLHLRDALGPGYRLHETAEAWVLSPLPDRELLATVAHVRSTRHGVARVLGELARPSAGERAILLVLDDQEAYYRYVSGYYPAGEFALSGGMFLNAGVPHFVTPRSELSAVEPTIAHEMTHAALSHLGLPRWIDEGLAVNAEHKLTRSSPHRFTPAQMRAKRDAFWTHDTIQQFWSGWSFLRGDDGNLLSYDLAQTMVAQLARDWTAFERFALAAGRDDGGAAAARDTLDVDLGALACLLLDRDLDVAWQPAPHAWRRPDETRNVATSDATDCG